MIVTGNHTHRVARYAFELHIIYYAFELHTVLFYNRVFHDIFIFRIYSSDRTNRPTTK